MREKNDFSIEGEKLISGKWVNHSSEIIKHIDKQLIAKNIETWCYALS